MSYIEEICYESLLAITRPGTEILRNYRPSVLKNPETGRNLELDFYLPSPKLGIEIQGIHHYEDPTQILRDSLKRQLCANSKIKLLEITIFQANPSRLHKMLAQRCGHVLTKFDRKRPDWEKAQEKYRTYKRNILITYDTNYFIRPEIKLAKC